MLEQIAKEKTVDILNYVTQLRKQRNLMVQTEPQYIFIHDTLLDVIISGETEIHASKLRNHVQEMIEPYKETGISVANRIVGLLSHLSIISKFSPIIYRLSLSLNFLQLIQANQSINPFFFFRRFKNDLRVSKIVTWCAPTLHFYSGNNPC